MNRIINVAQPVIGFKEMKRTLIALNKKEISGYSSQYVPEFEKRFAEYCGVEYAVAVNSGTSAIHLALEAIGISSGDEVLVSSYTNMATFFPVLQLGAKAIPVDIDPLTYNMDPLDLVKVITARTKAIIVVHIFGHPAPMDEIMKIANELHIPVIEDCAEAHGAEINGKKAGSFGLIGCFSFYANKLMTTGEGGMCITNSENIAKSMRSIASLSFGKINKFIHERDGYNFRMSNIQAAIGLGQLERLPKMLEMKRTIAFEYNGIFEKISNMQLPIELPGYKNVYWMYHIQLLNISGNERDRLISDMSRKRIETRPGFVPFSDQEKVLTRFNLVARETNIASQAGLSTLYLPSGPKISRKKIKFVAEEFIKSLKSL
jgi:perosamine synthetase